MFPPVLNTPHHLPPHPIPLGFPRAPTLGALFHAWNLQTVLKDSRLNADFIEVSGLYPRATFQDISI